MVEAADLFNASAFRRTVAGIAKSLGEPKARSCRSRDEQRGRPHASPGTSPGTSTASPRTRPSRCAWPSAGTSSASSRRCSRSWNAKLDAGRPHRRRTSRRSSADRRVLPTIREQDDLLRDPARARGRALRQDGRVLQGQPERDRIVDRREGDRTGATGRAPYGGGEARTIRDRRATQRRRARARSRSTRTSPSSLGRTLESPPWRSTATKTFKNFIGGEWVDAASGETFETTQPRDRRGDRRLPDVGRRGRRPRGRGGEGGVRGVAARPGAAPRRDPLPLRRAPRRAQGRARRADGARDGQGAARGRRRRPGSDRHELLHGRRGPAPLRPDDAVGAARQVQHERAHADRRRRRDHAVELPDRDPVLEDRARARLRQHDRLQAGDRHAAAGRALRRAARRGGRPGRRRQHRPRRRRRGRRPARAPPGRAGDHAHRLARDRRRGAARTRPRTSSTSTSSSAARTRSSSSTTPTSTSRSRGSSGRRSAPPASAARRPRA